MARFHRKAARAHSRLLVPTIDKLLKKARLRLKDIDGFCIGIGPGSFTGLRIGVTTVKGLAYSLGKPIVAVPTLDIIAHNARNFKGIICPVLDARKGKVYACLYKSDGKVIKRISKYLLLPMEELARKVNGEVLFLGDASGQIFAGDIERLFNGRTRKKLDWHPRAEVVAQLSLEHFRKKRFVTPEDLEPLYLYSKECDITGW